MRGHPSLMMDVFWLEQRLADVPATDEWLGPAERDRLLTLKIPKRRADWRLGRWTAKQAIASLFGISELSGIEIVAEPSGAPRVLLANEPAGVTISLTHRAGVGACAVAEHGVIGCDVELIEERSEAFLQDYFTTDELARIARAARDRATIATIIWSAKECALKAVGEGLRRDTRSVCVQRIELAQPATWSALSVRCDTGESFEGWWYEADGLIRTLVTAPAPAIPITLDVLAVALI